MSQQQAVREVRTAFRGLVPADLQYFRWLEEISMSPDGQQIAYSVRQVDKQNNGYIVDVFLLSLGEGKSEVKITQGTGIASSLAWSSDSKHFAFAYRNTTGGSVWIVGRDGNQSQYAVGNETPSNMVWSPDSTKIAAVLWTTVIRGSEPTYGDPWPVPPTMKVITQRVYKLNGVGFIHDRYRHVWILDLPTEQWTQITDGECDYLQPQWNREGDRLAFIRSDREQSADLGDGELLVWNTNDNSLTAPLASWGGKAQCICWAPDDSALVFVGHNSRTATTRRTYSTIYCYRFADDSVVDLVPDSTDVIGNYAVADQRKGLTNFTVRWPGNSNQILFLLTEVGGVNLYTVDSDSGKRTKLAGDHSVVFEYSGTSNRVVYGEATTTNPGDLWLWDEGERTRLTNLNPWLAFRDLSVPEEYWYKGLENVDVHAWIMRPVSCDPTKRYPLVLQVHCSMFSYDFNFENQIMAQTGLAVGYFNQRGTTAGYGEAWTKATVGNKEDVDFQEIMLGVDDLLKRYSFVDGDRMGVTGGSCGGILTNWIVGHTDRFKAAVTQRSIANYVSQFGAADIGPAHLMGELETTPWEDISTVWNKSGLAHAANITTPLLIIQSDQDHRCPIEQAEELFVALRWMGKEVEFCWFEGENHGLSRGGRPNNRVERLRRIVGWFVKHLGTEPHSGPQVTSLAALHSESSADRG